VLEKCCGCFAVKSVSVGLKNSVGIAYRESKGVGSLLKAHYLPEKNERLYRFAEVFRTVFGHLAKSFFHSLKLCFSFFVCSQCLLCTDISNVPQNLIEKAYISDYKTLISLNRSNGGVTYFYNGMLIRKWAARNAADVTELNDIADSDATEIYIDTESKGSLVFQGFLLYVFAVMLLL
jgi:hypothetical protein